MIQLLRQCLFQIHLFQLIKWQKLLKNINKDPLLSLGLRLGEGSGAALAISVVKAAVACHSFMATFADAGVSQG